MAEPSGSRYPPIGDYALIGDCRTAALVARDGAIEWLCLPRFDGPSVFGAVLDRRRGGRFRIGPRGAHGVQRRYLPGTNVLETTFETATGVCRLTDTMHVAEDPAPALRLDHEVLRAVEGVSGEVELEVEYEPRPRYGTPARLRPRGRLGLWCDAGDNALVLQSQLPLQLARGSDGDLARAVFRVRAGEHVWTSLTTAYREPAVIPMLGDEAAARMRRTTEWWRGWSAASTYDGPYRDAVLRSALVLKLMAFAPSGAVIAAPTTSLPEHIGGDRNWDYRYCWLRDASFTVRALLALGQSAEAAAFRDWLVHSTRLTTPGLQVMYTLFGESQIPERQLRQWEGYAGSRPVRVGNNAHRQFQLDVYGEVAAAVAQLEGRGRLDRDTERVLRQIGEAVCRRWREPDDGIWEAQSGRLHYTHSKAMCWVALTRLIELHERGAARLPVDRLRREREAIRDAVEQHGFNERLGSYVATFDGDRIDASLLVLPFHGYVEATHPRMRATWERVHRELGADGLLMRYPPGADGIATPEGTFGICGFWGAQYLALAGRTEEATAAFEHLLRCANDLGLFSEEIARDCGALGNFPQAYTHVGLVNAAIALRAALQGQPGRPLREAER